MRSYQKMAPCLIWTYPLCTFPQSSNSEWLVHQWDSLLFAPKSTGFMGLHPPSMLKTLDWWLTKSFESFIHIHPTYWSRKFSTSYWLYQKIPKKNGWFPSPISPIPIPRWSKRPHGTLAFLSALMQHDQHDLAEARGQLARELFQAPEISALRAVRAALGDAPVAGLS